MQFLRVLVFLPCFIYAGVCLSAGNADNQILSAEHADNEVKNRLVGQCWKYNTFLDENNKTESELCFFKDFLHLKMLEWNYVMQTGRSFSWGKWYSKGNVVYFASSSASSGEFEQCQVFTRDLSLLGGDKAVPNFYNCTPFAHDWLEGAWGESIIRTYLKPTKIEE